MSISKQTENKILNYYVIHEDEYFKRFNLDYLGNYVRKNQDTINFINKQYDKYSLKNVNNFATIIYIKKDLTEAPTDLFKADDMNYLFGEISIGCHHFDRYDLTFINFINKYINYGASKMVKNAEDFRIKFLKGKN